VPENAHCSSSRPPGHDREMKSALETDHCSNDGDRTSKTFAIEVRQDLEGPQPTLIEFDGTEMA
jgi:hypothetical protein